MSKQIFFASLVTLNLLFSLNAIGSAQTLDWIRQEVDVRDRRGFGVTVDSLGNPVMVGVTNRPALPGGGPGEVISWNQSDIFVSKYEPNGNHLWTEFWGVNCVEGGIGCLENAWSVVADDSGNTYVAGAKAEQPRSDVQPGVPPYDAVLLSYDAEGTLRWESSSQVNHQYRQLSIDNNRGMIYAAGWGGEDNDGILSQWNVDGNEQWTASFDGSGADAVATFDGITFVENHGGVDEIGEILLYDDAGQQIGVFPGPSSIRGLVASEEVGLIAMGTASDVSVDRERNAVDLRRFDLDGNLIWQRQLSLDAYSRGRAIDVDQDGIIYLTGDSSKGLDIDTLDAYVTAISPNGDVLWSREFGFLEHDIPRDIALDLDGHVYVTGTNQCSESECDLDDVPSLYAFLSRLSVDENYQRGDFNFDGELTSADLDLMTAEIQDESVNSFYDLDKDMLVEADDLYLWVTDFKDTFIGDADLNGTVDFADFLSLSSGFGSDGGWSNGDFDASGKVDFADFLVLSNNFGKSGRAAASVPEPSSAFLALTCVAAFAIRRRKRV